MDGVLRPKAKTFEGTPCVRCGATLRYEHAVACVSCTKQRRAAWVEKNKAKHRAMNRAWAIINRKRLLALQAAWARRNKARVAAKRATQRAKLRRRTPKWLTADDRLRMRRMYEEAARKTRETGVVHHVDHVVPLNGRTVSGLHVPNNLRIIPATVNLTKGNRYVG